jgi:uncharacterized SAM-binding protein YcdF (DUF218 family)
MDTWSLGWAFRNLVAELLMPPGIWLVIIALTFFFIKSRCVKNSFIAICLLMIWVASTNYFANQLTTFAGQFLDLPAPLSLTQHQRKDQYQVLNPMMKSSSSQRMPQAIIILGGGRRVGALDAQPQYQQQDVSVASMERLRLGARLAKVTGLPILVTGGAPDRVSEKDIPEATLMSHVLRDELGIKANWVESNSNTTQENSRESARMLKKDGIQVIYLVTHFWHMPRAKAIFEKEGLQVVEAPMGYYRKSQFTPLDFYPSSEGFQRTRWVFHEILGSLWYRLKF